MLNSDIFIFKLTHKITNINKACCINVYSYYCENTKTYKIREPLKTPVEHLERQIYL